MTTIHAGAIVLAAGFSSRFGGAKLCASLDNGQQVAQQTVRRIIEAGLPVVVITRAEVSKDLRLDPHPQLRTAEFDAARRGMGATLAYGIRQALDWDTCLVCLADMPFIAVATYRQIAAAAHAGGIVIPQFESRPGNPVAFGRQFYAELLALDGDAGGRRLIDAHPTAVTRLTVSDPAVLADIDTPADLARHQP